MSVSFVNPNDENKNYYQFELINPYKSIKGYLKIIRIQISLRLKMLFLQIQIQRLNLEIILFSYLKAMFYIILKLIKIKYSRFLFYV